jgi:hypothetical protein
MAPEFHRRGTASAYFTLGIVLLVTGALSLLIASSVALNPKAWSTKAAAFAKLAIVGLLWVIVGVRLIRAAAGWRRSFVRLENTSAFICTPSGKTYTIPYAEIRAVDVTPLKRDHTLTITTPDNIYKFNDGSCPQLTRVAEQLRARAPKSKAPTAS